MEIWDGYREDGSLANIDLVRGEPIPNGIYHMVCEILVRHTDGDYLLMQRDFRKPNFGGYYEATAGGSALKGEDKITCAKRELLEETGRLHLQGAFFLPCVQEHLLKIPEPPGIVCGGEYLYLSPDAVSGSDHSHL